MKYCVFLFIMMTSTLFAQEPFNWINYPTIDGVSSIKEERMRHSRLVMGKVEKIISTSFFLGDDEKVVLEAQYKDDGNVQSVKKTNFDPESKGGVSSMVKYQFTYDETQKIVFESILTIIEGNNVENIPQRWPEYYPISIEPSKKDENGNATEVQMFGNITYSFYDEYNRKIMDSIPSPDEDGRKITYRYEGNKIYRELYFMSPNEPDELSEKEEYTIDENGNWIELKYFGLFDLEGENPSQIYTREITYR